MKSVILFVSLCAFVVAVPVSPPQSTKEPIPIIAQESVVEHDGTFRYSYESGDGTKSQQEGELKQVDPENAGEVSRGSYSYVGDDGKTYSVTYVADENGFQPQGDHLPTPPPIPETIARALAYLATAPPPEEENKSKKH